MNGTTPRQHRTDQRYCRHINDGQDVLGVPDSCEKTHVQQEGREQQISLQASNVSFAKVGCENQAHQQGDVRILVVDNAGSL